MQNTSTLLQFYKRQNSQRHLDQADVIHATADGPYITIYLSIDKPFIIAQPLKRFEANLLENQNFIRPSKSDVINLNHIKSYKFHQSGGQIMLSNGFSVTVSRRRAKEVQERILKF